MLGLIPCTISGFGGMLARWYMRHRVIMNLIDIQIHSRLLGWITFPLKCRLIDIRWLWSIRYILHVNGSIWLYLKVDLCRSGRVVCSANYLISATFVCVSEILSLIRGVHRVFSCSDPKASSYLMFDLLVNTSGSTACTCTTEASCSLYCWIKKLRIIWISIGCVGCRLLITISRVPCWSTWVSCLHDSVEEGVLATESVITAIPCGLTSSILGGQWSDKL